MKLALQGLESRDLWEAKGYLLPRYNVEEMRARTIANLFWLHFGAGNLSRAYHAKLVQDMLNEDNSPVCLLRLVTCLKPLPLSDYGIL